MSTGRIASIRGDKGFGFIKATGAQHDGDLFFHRSAVTGVEFDDLREGQDVEFEEERDPRSPDRFRAVNVHPIETGAGDGA